MPELPEVETVRRSLVDRVVGRRIVSLNADSFPGVMGEEGVDAQAALVVGRMVTGVRRRAKYLLIDLDDGASLMVHLRMTGQLLVASRGAPPVRFQHLQIALDDGQDLRFADQRKFGRVCRIARSDVRALELRLGPEPLGRRFTAKSLAEILARRSGKLKSVLLNQRVLAGLGNIYVDEALFRAALHPERPANMLSAIESRHLHRAIRVVLREGLNRGGTTFSSFQDAAGREGRNGANLRVYGRGGQPCFRCGLQLHRVVVGGRGTSYCPRCQRLDPGDIAGV